MHGKKLIFGVVKSEQEVCDANCDGSESDESIDSDDSDEKIQKKKV